MSRESLVERWVLPVPYLPAAAWSVKTSADEKSPCRDRYGHRRRELQQIVVLSAFCQGVEIFQQVTMSQRIKN